LLVGGWRYLTSWSRDGQTMAFAERNDLGMLSLDGEPTPSPFLATSFRESAATFSPNDRFVAYVSDKSGHPEVYVRPRSGPGADVIVSTGHGGEPLWGPDGRELFYRSGEQMLVAAIETAPTFSARPPKLLFRGEYAHAQPWDTNGTANFDISPDGRQFLMVRMTGKSPAESEQLRLVINWFAELKQLAPLNE
jgi:hypothetical protein